MLPYAANKAAISLQAVGADSISARGVWCKREIWRVRIVVGAHSVRPRADASIRPYTFPGKMRANYAFLLRCILSCTSPTAPWMRVFSMLMPNSVGPARPSSATSTNTPPRFSLTSPSQGASSSAPP